MTDFSNIVGVDMGGTSIRAGKVIHGNIREIIKTSTPAAGDEFEVLDTLIGVIRKCVDYHTTSIGIGVPSVVDTHNGIVYDVVNIPSWKEVHLRDTLQNIFHLPVYLNNDSNCFAAGEKIYGKGKPYSNVVGMTVGTGLGLGLIMNGNLYEGRNCGAGEFGMVPYMDSCFETYCSGQFFSHVKGLDAAEIHKKALISDPNAINLFNEFGYHMGMVMKSILYAFDPDIIVLGGSLSRAYNLYKNSMMMTLTKDFAFRSTLKNMIIEVSETEEPAILGAAALQRFNSN